MEERITERHEMSGYKPRHTMKQAKTKTTRRQRFGPSRASAEEEERRAQTRETVPAPRSPAQQEVSADLGQVAKLKADLGIDPREKLTKEQRQAPLTLEGVLAIPAANFEPATAPHAPAPVMPPVMPRQAKPSKADTFPTLASLREEEQEQMRRLIDEDLAYQEQEEAVKTARKAIKEAIAGVFKIYGIPGLQDGAVAVYYYGAKTKKTLNKFKLLENGVTVEQIMASYSESAPWEDVRVTDRAKPKKKREDGEEED